MKLFQRQPRHRTTFVEIDPFERQYLTDHWPWKGVPVQFHPGPLTTRLAKKLSDTTILGCFIDSRIDTAALDLMPRLQFIVTMSTGYDHIDVAACRARGVTITNIPSYGEHTVAEHTFALILALAKRLPTSIERTRRANFSVAGLQGFDLIGKTLGIIGVGRIGQHVAEIARALGMTIIAYDPFPNKALAKEFGFGYVPLRDLLGQSDIITLHAPHTKQTHHLINARSINQVKPGAYLINTARGELIETGALVAALKSGIIAGAGLDVLEGECLIREEKELLTKKFQRQCDIEMMQDTRKLLRNPRVIVTPHNAFNSREANERILATTIDNIKAFTKGTPQNIVK